jgi:hypothetical protein
MRERLAIATGSLIVVASVVLAIVLHRTVVHCSYAGGAPPPGCITSDYSTSVRIGIVIAGLILALLVIIGGRLWARWKHR